MRLIGFLILAILIFPPAVEAARAKAQPAARTTKAPPGAIRSLLQSGRHADLRWAAFSDVKPALDRLYARHGYAPIWIEGGKPTLAATGMIAYLVASDSLGLDPDDYDVSWLGTAATNLGEGEGSYSQGRFDLALSIAAARFMDAIEHGRVSPGAAGAQYPAANREPLDAIVEALLNEARQDDVIAEHQPQLQHYKYLKNALARYKALARDTVMTSSISLPRDLKPGMKFKDAPKLRRRLQALGDLGVVKLPRAKADTVYSPELVKGVQQYQKRHGLDPDGVIWPNTAAELKRPLAENIARIELALERWRWLPQPFSAPPIMVNVPAFRLYAYRDLMDREEDMLSMDVLVGSADRNATPLFAAPMSYLIFRPYWEVPAELMMDELGPRAAWDGDLLERQGIVLVKKNGSGTNLPLTPENLKRLGRDLRMRQLPGPSNVLGLVKFMFPNQHDVYLHDTQTGGLFALARRDFSHGCIRVSDPVALAEYVLRNDPGWDVEKVKEAMQGEDNNRVNLAQPVPVFVTYATAAAFADGEVRFYSDIYGLDSKLSELLGKGYPYPRTAATSAARKRA
jgi:murein L,D-transpeptidase YcbB/YkuD